MAFTTNLSGVSQVDDSVLLAFDQQFIIAAAQQDVMSQLATYKKQIGAKSIQFPKYAQLTVDGATLTETDDVVSEALADSAILLTPAEKGKAVTKTKLASLQTGGTIDAAAAKLVGEHMGRTMNYLASQAAVSGSNVLRVASAGTRVGTAATDIATVQFLNKLYNKLSRASIAPLADGMYVLAAHDDVIHDIRNASGAGSWQDLNKYSNAMPVLQNECGMIAGFRVVKNNDMPIVADAGAGGTVDIYQMAALGFNAIGRADSEVPHGTLTGPFDKLGRFVNVGWYGCLQFGLVDTSAAWIGEVASSLGANT
jgi:N4-gp56 family major capsid protein